MGADAVNVRAGGETNRIVLVGALAVGTFLLGMLGVVQLEKARLKAGADRLAAPLFDEKWRGIAAQRAILGSATIVPMYGSSELVVDMPNRAPDFFASRRQGFTLAPIGDRGYPPLAMAIALASLGDAARNRPVVLSLSGSWFLGDDTLQDVERFRAHYSQLQMGDAIFLRRIPLELAERLAQRVRTYVPDDSGFPMLNAALACLARKCMFERMLPVLAPLWAVRALELRADDYREAAHYLTPGKAIGRISDKVDWALLEAQGDSAWRLRSASNPFGIQDSTWQAKDGRLAKRKDELTDSVFLDRMEHAERWKDLDLLLDVAKADRARTLVLNTPLKGVYWDFLGVSPHARERYYARFDSIAARHGHTALSFRERDADPWFLSENRSHLSPKGWAVYDRVINAFVHDSLR